MIINHPSKETLTSFEVSVCACSTFILLISPHDWGVALSTFALVHSGLHDKTGSIPGERTMHIFDAKTRVGLIARGFNIPFQSTKDIDDKAKDTKALCVLVVDLVARVADLEKEIENMKEDLSDQLHDRTS